jgi:hypothetical protein
VFPTSTRSTLPSQPVTPGAAQSILARGMGKLKLGIQLLEFC